MIVCPRCGNADGFEETCHNENSVLFFQQAENGDFFKTGEECLGWDEVHFRCGTCKEVMDHAREEFLNNYNG